MYLHMYQYTWLDPEFEIDDISEVLGSVWQVETFHILAWIIWINSKQQKSETFLAWITFKRSSFLN
jgi:hypothetical protein